MKANKGRSGRQQLIVLARVLIGTFFYLEFAGGESEADSKAPIGGDSDRGGLSAQEQWF